MKNISIWKDTIKIPKYKSLTENKSVDVLIIGGGITGISTLYHLKESNINIILVEQNRIGLSTTANSTGKLTYLQNDLINKIRKSFNDEVASKYLTSQKEAIKLITEVIKKENIPCDLQKVSSYIYTNQEEDLKKIKNLEKILSKNNIKINHEKINIVKSKYTISVSDTYQFHPLKFINGLIKNNTYPIYENTSIKRIEKKDNYYICYTDKYKIKTKKVIIASHYPYFIMPFLFPIKGSLEKSYLSASLYKGSPLSLISYKSPFISIRNYKEYLIYLSNSKSINSNIFDKKNYEELLKKTNDINLKPEYLWSNIDIITNDNLPYIGEIKDNILIGTGYNTWGLTNGFLAGKILSDLITNKNNKYIELFNPKRINISQLKEIIPNGIKNIEGYVNGYITKKDNIIYSKINNKEIMEYIDEKGLHKVYRNCPHAGCKLIFNEIEKTWDCPCHGSRFNLDGKCISSPSNKDITVKYNNEYKNK